MPDQDFVTGIKQNTPMDHFVFFIYVLMNDRLFTLLCYLRCHSLFFPPQPCQGFQSLFLKPTLK